MQDPEGYNERITAKDLMHRRPTPEEVAAYAPDDADNALGPTEDIYTLQIDDVASTKWNRRARRVFVRAYVSANASHAERDRAGDLFVEYFNTLRKEWRRQTVRGAGPEAAAREEQERKKHAQEGRRRLVRS